MADNPRWTNRPAGSTWGDYGVDDERGRLNLLTPEKVLQGIAEVKIGKTFCLSLPLDYPGGAILSPRRHPPVLKPTMRGDRPNMNYPLRCDDPTATDIVCDDTVLLTLQYSTQWDSLAHVGQMFDADGDGRAEDVFYNGYRAGRDIIGPAYYDAQGNMTPCDEPQGARHLGVQNMAESCMQGRGVMIDLEAHFGRTGHIVSHDELAQVMRKDNVVVEPGDFVLFRTGFAEMLLEMNKQPGRPDLGQFRSREHARAALHGRRLRHAAAARALPVQAGLLSRRDVLSYRTGRLAASQQPEPLPVHRPATAPAWRGRFAGHAGGDRLIAHGNATSARRPTGHWFSG
jgi:hypothetical protein